MISPAAAASTTSSVRTAPWVGQVVDHCLPGERFVLDARPAVPRRPLPESLRRGIRVLLRCLEPILVAAQDGPSAPRRPVGGMSHRLNASVTGHIALEPNPSASRWYAVSRSAARAGEHGHDRDVLAELAQPGDQPAARRATSSG